MKTEQEIKDETARLKKELNVLIIKNWNIPGTSNDEVRIDVKIRALEWVLDSKK